MCVWRAGSARCPGLRGTSGHTAEPRLALPVPVLVPPFWGPWRAVHVVTCSRAGGGGVSPWGGGGRSLVLPLPPLGTLSNVGSLLQTWWCGSSLRGRSCRLEDLAVAHAGGGVQPQRPKGVRLHEVRESQGRIRGRHGRKQGHAQPPGAGRLNPPIGRAPSTKPPDAWPSRVGTDRRADRAPGRLAQALSQTKPNPPPLDPPSPPLQLFEQKPLLAGAACALWHPPPPLCLCPLPLCLVTVPCACACACAYKALDTFCTSTVPNQPRRNPPPPISSWVSAHGPSVCIRPIGAEPLAAFTKHTHAELCMRP